MSLSKVKNITDKNILIADIALKDLKSQQKALNENAEKLKLNIKESTDALCNALKGKEKQLLRQVDFVTAHQKSLLDVQLTNVWLTKGSLIGTQEILSKCASSSDNSELINKIGEKLPISLKPVIPIKLISVKLEANPVSMAIEKFGEAHLPSTIMHYDSPVVPAKTEEYGDSEQDVLHKSLDGSSSALNINVKFPKLANNSWLATSPTKSCSSSKMSNVNDNSRWLSKSVSVQDFSDKTNKMDICYSGCPSSLDDDSEHSFQVIDINSKINSPVRSKRDTSIRTSFSSSIEVIQTCDYEKDYNNGFDVKTARSSPCDLQKPAPLAMKPLYLPKELSCQANEPCLSYDDCVCDGFCETLANERAVQTDKWLEKNLFNKHLVVEKPRKLNSWLSETSVQQGQKRKLTAEEGKVGPILKHMTKILSSDAKLWLSASCDDRQHLNSSSLKYPSRMTYPHNPNTCWLSESKALGVEDDDFSPNCAAKILYSPGASSWILTNQDRTKKAKINDQQMKKIKDNKNSWEQEQKKDFQLSVDELKDAIEHIYETTKTSSSAGLYKGKESQDFWLSDAGETARMESKWNKLEIVSSSSSSTSTSTTDDQTSSSLFPHQFVDNNLDQWLVPKC